MVSPGATELIGWAQNPAAPIFHVVDPTKGADPKAGIMAVSVCGVNLKHTAEREAAAARDWERVCVACTRPRKPPPAKRIRDKEPTAPTRSAAPIQAEHLRVDPTGHLVIRVDTRETGYRWIVLDVPTGTLVGEVADAQAKKYPTLRTLQPPVDLIGGRDLAAEWDMSLTAVSQLQKRRPDFPEPDVRLGGRGGWFPERLGELLSFNLNRGGRAGGGRPPGKAKRRKTKRSG